MIGLVVIRFSYLIKNQVTAVLVGGTISTHSEEYDMAATAQFIGWHREK